MVIVRKVPARVQRTSDWLSTELDLADQLAALGFFSSDDDTFSTASSSQASEARRGPKKRYGGVSSRRQPSVSAGLIRDFGRKRVGWRRRRRLDNELEIVHGRSDVDIDVDTHLEPSELKLELVTAPPSAPLACLFRDSDSLKKWQEFVQQSEDEQQRQLAELFQSEQEFGAKFGAGDGSDLAEPENFQKALGAAKRQLRKVGKTLCRQLRRLSSPSLMSSIENELLARMGEAAAAVPEAASSKSGEEQGAAVTCCWRTKAFFKAYTEKITLEALSKYYGYQLSWSNSLKSVQESVNEDEAKQDGGNSKQSEDDEEVVVTITCKHWYWPPVRLANIFFLNQNQQNS